MRPPLTKSDLRSIVISTFTLVFLLELLNCRISQAEERIDYHSQVEPILREYRLACHTQSDPEGGYVMESYQELLRGGTGTAITPVQPGAVDHTNARGNHQAYHASRG